MFVYVSFLSRVKRTSLGVSSSIMLTDDTSPLYFLYGWFFSEADTNKSSSIIYGSGENVQGYFRFFSPISTDLRFPKKGLKGLKHVCKPSLG